MTVKGPQSISDRCDVGDSRGIFTWTLGSPITIGSYYCVKRPSKLQLGILLGLGQDDDGPRACSPFLHRLSDGLAVAYVAVYSSVLSSLQRVT